MKPSKSDKKEMRDVIDLTTKILKKMDGYSIYICLRAMSGIMANMIVSHIPDQPTEEKLDEVFAMIERDVKGREMLERLLNLKEDKVH